MRRAARTGLDSPATTPLPELQRTARTVLVGHKENTVSRNLAALRTLLVNDLTSEDFDSARSPLDDAVASDRSMINQTGAARNSPKVPNGVIRMGEAATGHEAWRHGQNRGYGGYGGGGRGDRPGAGAGWHAGG